MITINGKEYGLFYSVGAHIAYDNWVIANPKASMTEGIIQRFICMVNAYNMEHGKKNAPPTRQEILSLPNRMLEEIYKAVEEQEKVDTETTVIAEPKKGKNAKTADQKS